MNHAGDRPLVLLIDDHTDSREMYAVSLAAAGFDVVEMNNADDATTVAAGAPAVVVTDLRMPGSITAADLCREFSALGVPVILLTAMVSTSEHDRMREAGCVAVLVKPLPPDELVAEVCHVTGRVP